MHVAWAYNHASIEVTEITTETAFFAILIWYTCIYFIQTLIILLFWFFGDKRPNDCEKTQEWLHY